MGDRLPAQAGLMVGLMWSVYILRSNTDTWYYVGSTNDVSRRVREHNQGRVTSTKSKMPLTLVFTQEFGSEQEARSYERKIKKQRLLKESIVRTIESHWGIV